MCFLEVGIAAVVTLKILFSSMSLLMTSQVRLFVKLFLTRFTWELRWTVIDLMTFQSTFCAENLKQEGKVKIYKFDFPTYFSTNRAMMRLRLMAFFVSFEMPFIGELCAEDDIKLIHG